MMRHDLLYLRKPGGFSAHEWEQAIASTPNTQAVQLTESLEEIGDEQVWVSFGGPGAQVRFAYDPTVWVRSGDTHFWALHFFYRDGYVYFNWPLSEHPDDPVRVAALRFAELLGARIVDEAGVEQVL
jgi:hypothetical protein